VAAAELDDAARALVGTASDQIGEARNSRGEEATRSSLRVFWTIPALTAGCALAVVADLALDDDPPWNRWRADVHHSHLSCRASDCLFFGLGLPLWLRLVPMNSFYGVRLPSTFASDQRWYDVNAVFGKHLFWWSLAGDRAGIAGFYQLPRHQDAYPWAAITLTLVAVAASVVATLWWMRQHPVQMLLSGSHASAWFHGAGRSSWPW
jgi:hypothetical protein